MGTTLNLIYEGGFTIPSGKTYSHKFTCIDGLYWTVVEWDFSGVSGSSISNSVWAKHDASSLTNDARLHFQIIDPSADPIVNAGNSALAEWIAADGTDWQNHTITYNLPKTQWYIFRISQKRASGNSYAALDENILSTSTGGQKVYYRRW